MTKNTNIKLVEAPLPQPRPYKLEGGRKYAISISVAQDIFEGIKRLANELKVEHRAVIYTAWQFYLRFLHRSDGFIISNGKKRIVLCGCDRSQSRDHTLFSMPAKTMNVSPPVSLYNATRKVMSDRGSSRSRLVQAAILTWNAYYEGRPTVFCDACLEAVEKTKYLYATQDLQATAYLIRPNESGYRIFHRYTDKEGNKMLAFFGYVEEVHDTSMADALRAVIGYNQTDSPLVRTLADGIPRDKLAKGGWKIKKIWGEGLLELEDGSFAAVATCDKPKLI